MGIYSVNVTKLSRPDISAVVTFMPAKLKLVLVVAGTEQVVADPHVRPRRPEGHAQPAKPVLSPPMVRPPLPLVQAVNDY